jgi:hypothetical protein
MRYSDYWVNETWEWENPKKIPTVFIIDATSLVLSVVVHTFSQLTLKNFKKLLVLYTDYVYYNTFLMNINIACNWGRFFFLSR